MYKNRHSYSNVDNLKNTLLFPSYRLIKYIKSLPERCINYPYDEAFRQFAEVADIDNMADWLYMTTCLYPLNAINYLTLYDLANDLNFKHREYVIKLMLNYLEVFREIKTLFGKILFICFIARVGILESRWQPYGNEIAKLYNATLLKKYKHKFPGIIDLKVHILSVKQLTPAEVTDIATLIDMSVPEEKEIEMEYILLQVAEGISTNLRRCHLCSYIIPSTGKRCRSWSSCRVGCVGRCWQHSERKCILKP